MEYLDSDDDIGQKCILDIGSGTGRWYVRAQPSSELTKRAWEVAYQYPNVNVGQTPTSANVQVTGIDLVHSPIPNLPSNITYVP